MPLDYLTSTGPVFAIQGLPEEQIAVLLAKYSRNSGALRDILQGMIDAGEAGSAEWHQKFTISYGHASIAEHSTIHLGLEGISILATKIVEDCRLASFTEKSTRYVDFAGAPFHDRADWPPAYQQTCQRLFRAYRDWQPIVSAHLQAQRPDATPAALRARTCDSLRYLLPAGTLTNVGVSGNARVIAGLIRKLVGSDLVECRELAGPVREEASKVCPTLLRRTEEDPSRPMRAAIRELAESYVVNSTPVWTPVEQSFGTVRLLQANMMAERVLAAALLYPHVGSMAAQRISLSPAIQAEVINTCLAARPDRAPFPREAEHVTYRVDVTCDYGAYRDLQRHRMTTQTDQVLTPDLGYEVPPDLEACGLDQAYHGLMAGIRPAWQALVDAVGPHAAQYVIPLAFRKRYLMTLNLREAAHLIELRSAPQGHWSYRAVARDLHRAIQATHPLLASHIRVHPDHDGLDL